jgi:PAS domain S-box-containing protein
MSIDTKLLLEICDQIAGEIGAVVSIFAEKGEIVASSRRNRIGDFHAGGAKIMAGEANSFEVTSEEAARDPTMLEGCTLPIEFDGKRVFCVAVAAPLQVARAYSRVIQHWVVSLLRERALELSEQRFRDVAESAGDWIWETNEDLRFTYLSPRFFEIFPIASNRVIGKTHAEFAGGELEEPHWKDHYVKLSAHVPFRDLAYTTTIADGKICHIEVSGKPVYAPDGRFIGYRGTGRDITEQVEVERALKRNQQLLSDAIETISEGFSLFDRDDRLVMFNSKYRAILYPDVDFEITAGMAFESIIRRAAQSGYVREAHGRVDEWVQERLAHRRKPGEAHIHQRGDGRWILVSERRTADGGTVAVYSDITELKSREEQLSNKSNALEQLSQQLSRYLSPQVYESIFTGRHEVKVDSRRKKLTVFFSDIADFTETTDRLESEDLTQLLNHYLTEMSQIALAHGATIDKFVGDAILIFFGDPETKGVKEDALACVKMAIAMRKRMHDLDDIWRESGIEKPLRSRMGIHTDYCTVGNFGSETRMDYTIIGGGVNTASRLESLATPGEILISYETFAHVKEQILCEEHGKVEVKGIAYPVTTYRVVDSYENLGRERRHFREEHPKVKLDLDLEAMTSEDRDQAAEILRRALDVVSSEHESARPEQARKAK